MKNPLILLILTLVCTSSYSVVDVPDNVTFNTTFCNQSIQLKIVCDGPTVARVGASSSVVTSSSAVSSSTTSSTTTSSSVATSSSTTTSSSSVVASSSTSSGGGGSLVATSDVTATPVSTSQIDITWDKTQYPQATGYAVMRSPSGGQETDWTHIGTAPSTADGFSDTGLSTNTEYVYTVYPIRSSGSYNYEMAIAVTLSAPANTVVATNDAQVIAAANNSAITDIRLAAGTYTDAIDVFSGKNRNSNKLTIRADDPNNPPTLNQVAFDLGGSSGLRFYHLDIYAAGGDRVFSETQGSNTPAGSLTNCTFAYNNITGPAQNLNAPANPNYWSPLAYMFDLANYYNSGNTIFGNYGYWIRQFLDVRPNGHQLIANNTVKYWYYDFTRFLGQPDEGRVEGTTNYIRNLAIHNVSIYEEIDNANEPHADLFQMFNTGGTNPHLKNIFLSQNYSAQDVSGTRVVQFQANLSQTRMENVLYHENLFLALSAHCLWVEGAFEFGVSKHACASHNGGSEPTLRVFNRATSNILVKDSIIPNSIIDDTTDPLVDIEAINVVSLQWNSAASETIFAGPLGNTTELDVLDKFTPNSAYAAAGPLTQEGQFRGGLHFPSAPRNLSLTGGSGSFTITSLDPPILNSPVQKYLGGDTYTYNVRYANAGTAGWTTQTGVTIGQTITGVGAGSKDVQIRAVNAEGVGVWTDSVSVTVN